MSTIDIKFPNPPSDGKEIPKFLKQMELCIHHARKAYEVQLQDAQGPREDDYIAFRTPTLDETIAEIVSEAYERKEGAEYYKINSEKLIEDNLYEEHKDIVLRIVVE